MSNNKTHQRRVSSKKLRAFLNDMADELCSVQDKMTVVFTGNTFKIHIEGGSINITINQKGGEK